MKHKTLKILFWIIASISSIGRVFASGNNNQAPDPSEAIKMNILPTNVRTVIQGEELKVDGTTSYLDLIISGLIDSQLFFGMIVAITVFIILGGKLLTANGEEEKHSEAIRGFIYAGVGLALIPLGWAIIRLITSISLN